MSQQAYQSRYMGPAKGPTFWNALPISQNVEDRRDGGLFQVLMDKLHAGYGALTGEPLFGTNEGSKSRVTGSPYANDIENAAQMIRFQSTLRKLGEAADSRSALNAYYDQNEADR